MRRALVTVVAAVLLAACGTDPQVREPDPTPSGSAPTQPVPSMPAQAREDSDEGRVAFVTHWIDVFNYAQATGDVDALAKLSDRACKSCGEYIELYEDTYAAGGYFRGGTWTVVDLAIEPEEPTAVFVRFTADAAEYKADQQSEALRGNAEETSLMVTVSGDSADRRVADIKRIES